jgi:tetratricopeptide (TPR) repeat protein
MTSQNIEVVHARGKPFSRYGTVAAFIAVSTVSLVLLASGGEVGAQESIVPTVAVSGGNVASLGISPVASLTPTPPSDVYNPIVNTKPPLPAIHAEFIESELPDWHGYIDTHNTVTVIRERRAKLFSNNADTSVAFQAYQQGLEAISVGNLNLAIETFTEAIRLSPQFAEAYLQRGLAYYELQNYENAITDYNTIIEFNPQSAISYTSRALAYSAVLSRDWAAPQVETRDQIYADLNKAILLEPAEALYYYNRGVVMSSLASGDEPKDNTVDFSEAIRLDPTFSYAYFRRGIQYNGMHRYPEALADLNEALQFHQRFPSSTRPCLRKHGGV